MKTLDLVQIEEVSGGSCNWHDFGQDVVKGAVTGGLTGAVTGGTVSLGSLAVPGWAAGAITGGAFNGLAYGVACSW